MTSPDVEKASWVKEAAPEKPMPSYATPEKPTRTGNARRRLIITLGIIVLAIVGLIVGLSVGFSCSKGKSETPSSLETDSSPTTGGQETTETPEENDEETEPPVSSGFPYSKEYMDFVCSSESIAESAGRALCEEACEAASCCDPFGLDDTCLQDDLESCINYAKCQIVLKTNDIDPAPPMLAKMCSLDNIAEDRTDCENACSPVECCYSDEESCVASKFLSCLDYAPCQNLRNDTKVPVAPTTLQEVCALNRTADEDCEAACKPAACCVDHSEGCLQSDFISCLTYAPCGGLLIPPLHNQVPQAPNNITELCTVENLLGDGRDDCASACSTGECCTEVGSDNCFLSDPLGCLPYAQCGLLQLTGGDIPRAPENLTEICSWENLQQGGPKAAPCIDACQDAACCVGLNGSDESCVDQGNFFVCTEYYPCSALFITGGGLQQPGDNVEQVCSADAVALDDGVACQEACSDASCCFAIQDSCIIGNADVCIDYLNRGCYRADGWLLIDYPF